MAKSGVSLDFRKVASMPSSLVKGTVYFDESDHLIKVATGTGSTDYQVFSGVRDVTWNASTNELVLVNPAGTTIRIDFDSIATITELNEELNLLREGIGFPADTNRFGANGIADTSYLNTADSSTVVGALKILDAQVHAVESAAGVVSIGNESGVITLKNGGANNGDINLTMNGKQLQAAIVGLGSAAYTDSDAYDASGAAAAVLGQAGDSSTTATVYGVQAKAEAVKTELLGNATNDTSASKTIEGLIKKIEAVDGDSELHLYSGTSGTTNASTVTADGQTYRLVQGTTTVATFNIEKDSFVTDGSVVSHSSSGAWGDAGTYIQLALRTTDTSAGTSSEKVIYIPATSLVDTYTANNANHNVTVTVNGYEISADVTVTADRSQLSFGGSDTIIATVAGTEIKAKLDRLESVAASTAGGVQLSEASDTLSARVIDNAITTAKIADANVTTAKLDSSVQTALGKANTAVQTVTGETATTDGDYVNVKVTATRSGNDVTLATTSNVTTKDVSTAATNANGLATAYDVQTFVKAYVAEQLQWAEFHE